MGTQGTGNFNAGNIKKVEIELDSKMLAAALAKNTDALTSHQRPLGERRFHSQTRGAGA